ncbi:hypothetical protein QBK99_05105 [Corticibacterium sp. UT-5YL-CI-8]|nr:hypothetical protein [Tianweitania sp. UT-5YL-CI-8]
MSTLKPFNRIGNFFSTIGSAVAAANAVERGLIPEARHLRKLGIDPRHFKDIARF